MYVALGLAQLEQIDAFIAHHRAIAQFYQRELIEIAEITVCKDADWAFNVHWLSWILVEEGYKK